MDYHEELQKINMAVKTNKKKTIVIPDIQQKHNIITQAPFSKFKTNRNNHRRETLGIEWTNSQNDR